MESQGTDALPSEKSYDSESDLDIELTYLEELDLQQEKEVVDVADKEEEKKDSEGTGNNFLNDLINANFDDVDLDKEDEKRDRKVDLVDDDMI